MAAAAAGTPWTRPADVREAVRKRWPALLTAFLAGQEWAPLGIPLRGPAPAEIGGRLAEVQAWAAEWERAGRGPLRVEYRQVGGRLVGVNQLPGRAWLDGYAQAWDLLGTRREVSELVALAGRAKAECPRVLPWVERNPVSVLRLAADWDRLLATVRWIDEHQRAGLYLRQVDVPGVDTKFIEGHKGVLSRLLDLHLHPARINAGAPDFAGRYGFRRKPDYVRFRYAGPGAPYTELTVRADEFTAPPPGVTRACILENEVTYLAFPLARDSIAFFGDGFAILNRLRGRFPHARSILMDRETLLAHQSQWVTEKTPTKAALGLLDPAEQAVYQDLVNGTFGPAVRLELERLSLASLEQAFPGAGQTPDSLRSPARRTARNSRPAITSSPRGRRPAPSQRAGAGAPEAGRQAFPARACTGG